MSNPPSHLRMNKISYLGQKAKKYPFKQIQGNSVRISRFFSAKTPKNDNQAVGKDEGVGDDTAGKKRRLLLDRDTVMGIYKPSKDLINEDELTPDEINAMKNNRIIKREFFNDGVCISLKYISVLYAGEK